ncbi:uncharacterized protein LOC118746505, partial [Rhagoletis pomonella]|uniref:uncharacterized protein LOC118746505 n=1 Tax=Rhagoletis pomonella TaxID=28610 RepID=UPI00177C8877
MDEVDIDGEDFNELEARLYGQIHHEAVDSATVEVVNNAVETPAPEKESVERIVTAKSVVNRPAKSSRVPDTRYWVNSTAKPAHMPKPNESNTTISKASIAANQNKSINDHEKLSTTTTLETKKISDQSKKNETDNVRKVQSQSPNNDIVKQIEPQEQQSPEKDKLPNENFRINPAAVAKNTKLNLKNKKQKKAIEHVPRSGPFMQQEKKLQKALVIQEKKKKSKKVRNKNRKKQKQVETIVLESASESSSGTDESDDDVVLIPAKPPPTITLSDSDTDAIVGESNALQLEEENAIDASDVFIDKKTKSSDFTTPTEVRSNVAQEASEKQAEQISSRCTSPCSVLSSDDFIGQTDRSRLLEDNCMADDQDLALLTADVDSLMQPPQAQPSSTKQTNNPANNSPSDDVMCTGQFTVSFLNSANKNTEALEKQKKQQNNYRVEQAEFRAMDVYESESDITDSVYSKGTVRNRTIINAVDTSSEAEDLQQAPLNQKVKRFCKRRTSSSNRGSDALNDDASTDDELEGGVSKTPIPYILCGTAVERCNKKLRKRTQSLSSRRASAGGTANAAGNMSDTEFIATLNSLVQGREEDINKGTYDKSEDDENSEDQLRIDSNKGKSITQVFEKSVPVSAGTQKDEPDRLSVRSVHIVEPPPPSANFSDAVPDDALAGLDKIFDSIDNMVEPNSNFKKKPSESENSSENEIEVIQPPVRALTTAEQIKNKNALPIGHIVYHEHTFQQGGVGWNEEMAKFYNLSWHGERFSVVGVQNRMDKDRSLWKIYTEDRFPKTRPYSNQKCYNCCEFGHTRAKCRRPKKPPVCYMCGESGHFEPRCPNTICLRCGNKTQMFTKSCNACTFQNRLICPICKVRGHSINLCPDKWRRYHSTTQPNAHPHMEVEFNKRKMCCVCGANGHFSDTCRSASRFMEYPVIISYVKSHQKSYNDLLFTSPRLGIALNLLYRPLDTVVFHMAEKTSPNDYYGRFLKAVGLGNLLPRKRPSNCLAAPENPSKQARSLSGRYVPNPYGRSARGSVQTISDVDDRNKLTEKAAPNQVQEVSGSVISAEAVTSGALEDISSDEGMTHTNEVSESMGNDANEVEVNKEVIRENEFKAPGEASAIITTHQSAQHKENLTADSDSNYSFSDHFEVPPAAVRGENETITGDAELDVQPSTSAATRSMLSAKRVREMDPLPDFIPITCGSDVNTTEIDDNFDTQTGISRRFVAANTDDEQEDDAAQANDTPCEAKIYLTHFHSNYLLSPDGHEFLKQKSEECNIKARLDWTSVGHVLVIFGLPSDQDIFHKALLDKCKDLMDRMSNKQLSAMKVPKRIDALIRFLRENISQLQSDLGDVNDLQRRINNLEKSHTKANMKLAEKFRRLLNMILLGQAGLCDGDKHLDKLFMNLKSLINDYQAENMVPQSLREEIDSHSRLIFTSYRHENYPDLIQSYN